MQLKIWYIRNTTMVSKQFLCRMLNAPFCRLFCYLYKVFTETKKGCLSIYEWKWKKRCWKGERCQTLWTKVTNHAQNNNLHNKVMNNRGGDLLLYLHKSLQRIPLFSLPVNKKSKIYYPGKNTAFWTFQLNYQCFIRWESEVSLFIVTSINKI